MARKTKQDWERKLINSRGVYFLAGLAFLAIGYGFASLAINYGSFWQYVLGFTFLIWGFKELKHGVLSFIRK